MPHGQSPSDRGLDINQRIVSTVRVRDVPIRRRIVLPSLAVQEISVAVLLAGGKGEGQGEAPVFPVGHLMRGWVPVVKFPAQSHRLNRLVYRQLKGQAAVTTFQSFKFSSIETEVFMMIFRSGQPSYEMLDSTSGHPHSLCLSRCHR